MPVYMPCSLSSRSFALKNYRTRPLIQPATQPSQLVASRLAASQLLGGEMTVSRELWYTSKSKCVCCVLLFFIAIHCDDFKPI